MGERPVGFVPDGFVPDQPANRKPAATEDYLPAQPSWLDSAKNFATNFAHTVDPRPMLKMVYDVAQANPLNAGGDQGAAFLEDLKGLGGAQAEQFKKGYKAYKEGRISEAVGHTLAGAVPLIGPQAAALGEQVGSGDVSGALGTAGGFAALAAVPKVLPKSVGVRGVTPKTAELAEAVKFAEAHGIPIDAATATGSELVKSIQKKVSDSMGGAGIAERFKAEQARGLATVGEQLAAKSNKAGPVTSEQAGMGVQDAVREVVHDWNREATGAYERLRALEADPKNTSVIPGKPLPVDESAPGTFTLKPKATADEVFLEALKDARKQGYTGSAAELKGMFDDKVKSARSLKESIADTGEEYGHAEFLKSIRKLGGIRGYDKGFVQGAPAIKMRGEYEAVKQLFPGKGASSIFRDNGVPLDDMLMQLQQDARWKHVLTDESDLLNMLHEIGMKPVGEGAGIEHYLGGVGVKPGTQWWKPQPEAQAVPMAVDLRPAKAALKETYDGLQLEGRVAPLMGAKATAARALARLMEAPDHAPLSAVDAALGELKSFARSDNPDLRSIGQGKAVPAINQLHAAVQKAAEAAGPEAVQALTEGRQATQAKYIAAKVLKGVAGPNGELEPVAAYRRLTAPGNAAIQQLRKVAAQAPETIPHIGRAVLDGLLDTATADGGFDKAKTIRSAWNKINPETKAVLYRDPAYVAEVDNFLRFAEKAAENPNPSGTARINNLFNVASAAVGYPVAKLLYSKAGVKLLTEGYRLPLRSPVAVSSYTARLTAALKAQAAMQPVMAGDTQDPQRVARGPQ